jgi:hypothetical protein
MVKVSKIILFFSIFICFIITNSFTKNFYIITLKGGTKIKADSYIKEDGVIKVFKYGGYIIYPLENVKDIKKIDEPFMNKMEHNPTDNPASLSNDNSSKQCNPIIKYVESNPIYNSDNNSFELSLKGEINNNCPKDLKNVYLIVSYFSQDNQIVFTHKEFLDKISSYDSLKFSKKFKCNDISKIKYFKYKLEFIKE